jgi:hypothetical protein
MPTSFGRGPPVWSLCARLSAYSQSRHSVPYADVGIRYDVGIIGEVLVANCAYAALFSDLAVHQFPHFRRGSQFPISSRVVGILNSLNSKSDQLWFGQRFASTTRERFVDRTQFIAMEFHGTFPAVLGLACEGVQSEVGELSSSSCLNSRACNLAGSRLEALRSKALCIS